MRKSYNQVGTDEARQTEIKRAEDTIKTSCGVPAEKLVPLPMQYSGDEDSS